MRNPRPCDRCGEKFTPTGKFCKLCDECRERASRKSMRNCKITWRKKINEI